MNPKIEDYAIIANEQGHVLLVDGKLPRIESENTHFWQSTVEINIAMHQQFGVRAVTRRCMKHRYDDGTITNHYLMEPQGIAWLAGVKGATYTGQGPEYDSVSEWLSWDQPDHPLRVPWYRPGWFERIESIIHTRLGPVTGPIEQLRSWQRSAVLRVPTDSRTVYVKAAPDIFAHELPLTSWLAHRFSANVPEVVYAETIEDIGHLLFMYDYGGLPLSQVLDVETWASVVRRYAALQIDLVQQVDELIALGCPRNDLNWLRQGAGLLFDDMIALQAGASPLSDTEIGDLQAVLPRLQNLCDELASLRIPLTLEHGDLWSGQVIVDNDGNPIFTDWSDSAITHPFFSLPFFLTEIEINGVEDQLTAAYLEPWAEQFAPLVLKRALEIVQMLSPLYSAVVYQQHILPGMEIQWEMERMVTYNLRLLLLALASGLK